MSWHLRALLRYVPALRRALRLLIYVLAVVLLFTQSSLPPADQQERIRAFTRDIEFDYVTWTLKAFGVKFGQTALGAHAFLPPATRSELVKEYLELLRQISRVESQIEVIFADPEVKDVLSASAELRQRLAELNTRRRDLEPLAESILQAQVSQAAAQLGLTLGGQPIPPVLYHTTPPPDALIVSPREVIRQDADISIQPGLPLEKITELEQNVDRSLNVSSLVVGIGGIGLYPTMVMQTTDLNWLSEVVAHEWVHNFLTLRPLGLSYLESPELRTMNETAASIAGKEIGSLVIAQYYPELTPPPVPATPPPAAPGEQPAFDFRKEMHQTRLTVDQLLKEGRVEEAESYMEARRRFFWENGYRIRKINQAYFAFYGAYADEPLGAAGEDPVGAAVRQLRAQSSSLAQFLNRISWMWTYEQLKEAVTSGSSQPVSAVR